LWGGASLDPKSFAALVILTSAPHGSGFFDFLIEGRMETKTAVSAGIALLIGVGVIVLGFRFAAWLLTGFFILNCLVLIIVVLLRAQGAETSLARSAAQAARRPSGPRGAANVLVESHDVVRSMFIAVRDGLGAAHG